VYPAVESSLQEGTTAAQDVSISAPKKIHGALEGCLEDRHAAWVSPVYLVVESFFSA
jgi:hypothetical protein